MNEIIQHIENRIFKYLVKRAEEENLIWNIVFGGWRMNEEELKSYLNKKVQIFLKSGHIFFGVLKDAKGSCLTLIEKRPHCSAREIKIVISAVNSITEFGDSN